MVQRSYIVFVNFQCFLKEFARHPIVMKQKIVFCNKKFGINVFAVEFIAAIEVFQGIHMPIQLTICTSYNEIKYVAAEIVFKYSQILFVFKDFYKLFIAVKLMQIY